MLAHDEHSRTLPNDLHPLTLVCFLKQHSDSVDNFLLTMLFYDYSVNNPSIFI